MSRLRSAARVVVIATVAGSSASFAQRSPARPVAIVGVTIIDPGSRESATTDQTIIVTDGRIEAIGPRRTTTIPQGAVRVAARGKFMIPGLWDAHVHFMNTGVTALPLLVAQGVTSVREMGGYIDSTRAWQARMRAGTLVGPRIITPGPMLESPRYLQGVRERSVRDPRLARRILPYRIAVSDSLDATKAIDSLIKLRVDFVKFRTVASPEAFYAILRAAHGAGLTVAGHQASVIPLRISVDSGQDDIEHAIQPPLSRVSEVMRDSIYHDFATHGTWYTPTLTVSRAVILSGDSAEKAIFSAEAVRHDERRQYASPWLLEWWRMQVDERALDTSSTRGPSALEAYRSSASDLRKMWDVGVKILAGTDAGSVLVYPGFSLHEELRLMVEDAGLSPKEALWSATIGPARFAGLEATLGRIARGQIADLVLLDANPLANIRNTRRIFAVIQGGRLYNRRALDSMLSGVRREVAR